MRRAEESSALIGERTSSTPLNFALGTAQRRPNCRARIGGPTTPDLEAARSAVVPPSPTAIPAVTVPPPDLAGYDALLRVPVSGEAA